MPESSAGGLESQIAALEQQLAQKRAELGSDIAAPYERAEVHAAVGEQIRQAAPSHPVKPPSARTSVPSWQDPAIAGTIQQLVTVAFTQSVQAAIAQALQSDNPALIDALHDILADQLHEELLKRSKIGPAP